MLRRIPLSMVMLSAALGVAAHEYEIIDLGTLGGLYSQANAINDGGQIVGQAQTAGGQSHAVSWQDGIITDLGALTPDQTSNALGINSDGLIVGDIRCATNTLCATLWTDGVPTHLEAFGSGNAQSINQNGMIVGFSYDLNQALLYTDGVVIEIGPDGIASNALDINDNDQVVGTWQPVGTFETRGFLYEGGVSIDLGLMVPHAINNNGQIVGYQWIDNQYRAVLRQPDGKIIDLAGVLAGTSSSASDINDSGWIVGWSGEIGGARYAFLYVDGHTHNLGTLGGTFSSATSINEHGQIVGLSHLATGGGETAHAVLWNPIPEPPPPQVALTSAHVAECAPARVFVTLTNEQPVQAFSLGVAHAPAVATLTAIDFVDCPVVQSLNSGQGPDYFGVDLAPGTGNCGPEIAAGGTVYCITSQTQPSTATIPAGSDQPVARLTYEVVPGHAVGTESPLAIVGCLGGELPREVVITIDGLSYAPNLVGGTLTVDPPVCWFQRGDANGDSRVDISDVVTLLMYMFEGGRGPLRCEDSGDANDDGALDIADPIRILGRLFAEGPPLAPPYPGCGTDPTVDALRCGVNACE